MTTFTLLYIMTSIMKTPVDTDLPTIVLAGTQNLLLYTARSECENERVNDSSL